MTLLCGLHIPFVRLFFVFPYTIADVVKVTKAALRVSIACLCRLGVPGNHPPKRLPAYKIVNLTFSWHFK